MTKNLIKFIILAGCMIWLSACSQADVTYNLNFGKSGRVTCYAAAVGPWFDDFSTGKIEKHDSDGFYFVSATTQRLTEVTGNCVIDYGAERVADFKAIR